jgi:hypothetical protein
MSTLLAEAHRQLVTDPFRKERGFAEDFAAFNKALIDESFTDDDLRDILCQWLTTNQPCLFGRIAARKKLLQTVFIREADIEAGDEAVRDKIQNARTEWTRRGFRGEASGFVILAVSPKLTYACPNESLKSFAKRLCELYLLDEIYFDRVHHDELFLEFPDEKRRTWRWLAGVNVFGAAGDGRWWHDHRIPGGIGFSINSVGHLVRSSAFASAMEELRKDLDFHEQLGTAVTKIRSLDQALIMAMQTIAKAAPTTSGPATKLIEIDSNTMALRQARCPISLPAELITKDYCYYKGWYNTDYTIPSEYFLPDAHRPTSVREHLLEFSYLFDKSVSNPDFVRMGSGIRVRSGESEKTSRMIPKLVLIEEYRRLDEALRTN